MFSLEFPSISHQDGYLAMIAEWQDFEAIPTNPKRLFAGKNYEEFLNIIETDIDNNPKGVNSTLFFFMQDDSILGGIQVRHHIDHPLAKGHGTHIGYGLRPSARGKGYAKEMLSLGLIEARKLSISKVVISADEDNPASWKTIESCGGILDNSILSDGRMLKIYHIDIV